MNTYFTYTVHGRIGEIVLDDHGAPVNMLSTPMMDELERCIDDSIARAELDALIIRSTKKDIFIAGADIHEIAGITKREEALEKSRRGQDIVTKLERLPFPTVAVIDGACLGGGLELALACTYRLVSDNPAVKIGLPETTLGILPGFGGTWRLPRLIGMSQALPMVLTGRTVDGARAFKLGLADGYYPKAFLGDAADAFIRAIVKPGARKTIIKKRKAKRQNMNLFDGNPIGRLIVAAAAKNEMMKRTRGRYPAQIEALRTVRGNYSRTYAAAMKKEREAFARLAVSDTAKKLIALFFTGEALKKDHRADNVRGIESAAVLGAGKMGGGIAWLISNAEIPVRMKDINWDAVGKGYAAVNDIYKDLIRIRKIDEREAMLRAHRVSGTVDYSGFANADFVIEAVVEDIEVKIKTFRELEKIVRPDTIIATNTSSLSVDAMAQAFEHPGRFIGFHFFNPVNRMPLIEVVPGVRTSEEVLLRTVAFARTLKKIPIVVRDCNGFLVNRILMAYLNEAMLMLEEGVPFTRIDAVMTAYGMPMGPFALLDEIGIKVGAKVAVIIAAAHPERASAGKLLSIVGHHEKLIGRSTGSGFYRYRGKDRSANPLIKELIIANGIPSSNSIGAEEIEERCLVRMINEAARCIEEGIITRPDYLDMAMLYGTGFPAFRGGVLRAADDIGIDVVLKKLSDYEMKYGPRFKASALLMAMRSRKERFYP